MTQESVQKWIWQQPDWPHFSWQDAQIQPLLRQVRLTLGILLGKASTVSAQVSPQAALDTLLQNIITSSAIEGETLNVQSLRSSLAKRLGLSDDAPYPTSERTEGLSNIMLDVVSNINSSLTTERLLTWHQWLFPNIDPIWQKIRIGQWRGDEPMQVVSGRLDRPTVHFEAPPRAILEQEITQFLQWFEQSKANTQLDPLLRAAIVHFWFVTLHPFDDGNGRLTRALTDLALAQVDQQSIRLYAMSAVILEKRSEYYQILEQSQRGTMDITPWLCWFLQTLEATLQQALSNIQRTMLKKLFWQRFYELGLLPEQVKVLNRLLDGGEKGFELGISASQYQKVAKVSKATATRHLADLVAKGCLMKLEGGGRNTRYQIKSITC